MPYETLTCLREWGYNREGIGTFKLSKVIDSGTIDKHDGTTVAFDIMHGLNGGYAQSADQQWRTYNMQIVAEIRKRAKSEEEFKDMVTGHQLEDFMWSWIRKSVVCSTAEYEWFYFVAEGQVQGICTIYHPKASRIDAENIFYVDYVAAAPWNRRNCLSPKFFCGIGTVLLRVALAYATSVLGYRPGFSLHSLPQAEDYYTKIGMIDLGIDTAKENLRYFEMESEQSERFLNA